MTTMQEMCDTIVQANILRKSDGTPPTAREIYESSPTGELWQVCQWYYLAKIILKLEGEE